MERIELRQWLEKRGLDILTGEACGLSMRLLCDVSPSAQAVVSEFLGGATFTGEPWNHSAPWVSVMLSPSSLRELTIYWLVKLGYIALDVAGGKYHPDGVYTIDDWAALDTLRQFRDRSDPSLYWRVYTRSDAPGNGMRNEHMFSGRIE